MYQKIQERIKALRNEKGYTQKQVAEYLNVAQKTYSDYEKGKIIISVQVLAFLAKLYGVDMDYICALTDVKASHADETESKMINEDCTE